jgi:hypothetical protein
VVDHADSYLRSIPITRSNTSFLGRPRQQTIGVYSLIREV